MTGFPIETAPIRPGLMTLYRNRFGEQIETAESKAILKAWSFG